MKRSEEGGYLEKDSQGAQVECAVRVSSPKADHSPSVRFSLVPLRWMAGEINWWGLVAKTLHCPTALIVDDTSFDEDP